MSKVIAHRGAWKAKGYPENSVAALQEAIRLGCYGSEFDVHLTKDNVVVVNHDDDYFGLNIETSTYQALLEVPLPNMEQLPSLEAFLYEGLTQEKTKLIVEIKTAPAGVDRTLKLARLVVEKVLEFDGQSMVEYICFNYEVGQLVRKLDPNAQISYLNGDVLPSEAQKVGYSGIDYEYSVYMEHPTWIDNAKDVGMTVNVWTVNAEEDMRTMISKGVDFITTNEPERLFAILKEKQ